MMASTRLAEEMLSGAVLLQVGTQLCNACKNLPAKRAGKSPMLQLLRLPVQKELYF